MANLHIFKQHPVVQKPAAEIVLDARCGQVRIQPCVINGQPHFVYPRGLQHSSPPLFRKLVQYAATRGYKLKEDQRRHDTGSPYRKERRRWAPVILFTASLLFEGHAYAESGNKVENTKQAPDHQIVLRIVPRQHSPLSQPPGMAANRHMHGVNSTRLQSAMAKQVFGILDAHYVRKPSDPKYIRDDLKQIANYYSEFPDVIALLNPLRNKNWELSYDAENWDTVGIGTTLEVDKAVIHFNTRAAAQLLLNRKCRDNPVCIASPADALLHELLHTHSMLIDGTKFIAQGGMSGVIYPYEHEYAIIDAERKLYASMSRMDDARRPQRTDHTGRTVYAHCPICIK